MCMNNLVEEIFIKFQKRSIKDRAYIVGIDGLGGAGKTTLVSRLESGLGDRCNVVVIHMDDHITERNKRYHTGYEEWYEYFYLQWDVEMLTDELFKKIQSNSTKLIIPFYEDSIDKNNKKTISITPNSIILIEGVFLQRREWKAFYDYTVFIDCPREIRYKRVLKRDSYIGDEQAILDKYKRRYWLAENHYLEKENPIDSANKVYTYF